LDDVVAMLKILKKKDEVAARVVAMAAFFRTSQVEIQGLRWEDLRDGEIHAQRTTEVEEGAKTEASLGAAPISKSCASISKRTTMASRAMASFSQERKWADRSTRTI
jgi:hypothetical protein